MAEFVVESRPVRTCVGCRQRKSKASLVRVVVSNGKLVVDHEAIRPGRGAYLHPQVDCFDLALRRRALSRALRVPSTLDAESVRTGLTGRQPN